MPLNFFYTMVQKSQKWPKTQIKGGGPALRQDPPPLDLSFWSFLTFVHHGIAEVERHLLWKFHKKKCKGKVDQMCHRSWSLA